MQKSTSNWFTQSPQFKQGMNVEGFLDNFFTSKGYKIERTTPYQERVLCLGDRIFTAKEGKSFYVEYKSGIQTYYTGNIFLETISVDSSGKPGWVYTCKANYIIYAALLNKTILVFTPAKLRAEIQILKSKFKEVKTSKGQNEGYNTHGVIVPLQYAQMHLAGNVITI